MDHQAGLTNDHQQLGGGATSGGPFGSSRPQWHRPVLQQYGVGAIAGGPFPGAETTGCFPSPS